MNNKKLKANAIVGVAPLGDPHFGENATDSPKAYINSKSKIKTLTSDNKGITLIALVITIIVMLILVAVTVTIAINGGLFSTAKQATTDTQYHADREMLLSAVIGSIGSNAEVDYEKLNSNLPEGFTKAEDGGYMSKAGNTFYVDKNGNITDEKVGPLGPPQVTLGYQIVTLTRDNVADYLGRVVTNYKGQASTNGYTVSTTYRLYYVDFDNKYGDGEGTVYLKADCNGKKYSLKTEPTPENPSTTDAIKIRNLNPGLYNQENENGLPIADQTIDPPNSENDNMKAVTWLTNTNNWSDLKPETFSDGITEQDINYIVGAPSLEMMMDSYNTHYGLMGDEPNTDVDLERTEDRVKLFYKYPYGSKNYGYGVRSGDTETYSYLYTSEYSVKTDKKIDSLYYAGIGKYYWLASPSAFDVAGADFILSVYCPGGGRVYSFTYNDSLGFCPLVSLKSSVQLNLE